MARTITTRLAIEGESEYKAKIKNINAELSLEEIYPVGGANSQKVSFGSDKVADELGIDTHEAYRLLNIELSPRIHFLRFRSGVLNIALTLTTITATQKTAKTN